MSSRGDRSGRTGRSGGTRVARLLVGGLLLALALAGAGVWRLTVHGFSARSEPWVIEAWVARRLRLLAIPAAAADATNPVASTDEVLREARAHFADHCASCHGNDGRGQASMGRNLYPKAPDMQAAATQGLTDGEIFYVIKNGVRFTGMPAWGEDDAESDRESWALVRFIRHLPDITPQELAQMRDLNPKSRDEWEEEQEQRSFLLGDDEATPEPATSPQHHH